MESYTCLQDVLKDRTESGSILCYPLGNSTVPRSIPYKSLYTQAQQNSVKIRALPRFQDRRPVLLCFEDHLDNIVWFWSVLLANGIPVILGQSSHSHINGLMILFENPICIATVGLANIFKGGNEDYLYTKKDVESMTEPFEESVSYPKCQGLETAILMLTSGSTGCPKAVSLSHHQILTAVAGKACIRPIPKSKPFFNWIGLDHVASLVEIHIQALWLGVGQVHAYAADIVSSPKTFLSLLHRHEVSRTFAPNFFLAKLVLTIENGDGNDSWDLSNLVVLASGGEVNDVDTCIAASSLLYRYGALKNVIMTGFGMTETCAGAIFNLRCPDYDIEHGRVVTSLGVCMDGIEMRITVPGKELQLAAPNEPGDLEIRGDAVFKTYYRDPAATAEAFTSDGWFRTGDTAIIDDQGCLSLNGRAKDVVNINGAKFPMSNIQTALEQATSHDVARIIAFASRAAHTEQIVVALIPLGIEEQVKNILEIEHLITQVCHLQVGAGPIVFTLSEQSTHLLPTSSLGKISRAKMAALYESGAFAEDLSMHQNQIRFLKEEARGLESKESSDTERTLIEVLAELQEMDPESIRPTTSIFELGFSSIDVIRLKLRIDQRLGISVPVTTIMRHPTPSMLAKALGLDHKNSTSSANSAYDPVVTFNSSGSKTPLWLVHPGIGEVLVFVGLAQHLASDDRPVYALRARGFEPGHERFTSIEEAVDTYIAAIRNRQPTGPYAIAGYSYGTMLAFEMTKKLEAEDGPGTVQFVGSFNLPPHIKNRMRQLHWNNCLLHLAYFLGLMTEENAEYIEESDFQTMTREDALGYILDIANKSRLEELGLEKPGLTRWVDVAYDLPRMATDYEPKGQVSVLDIFFATPLKAAAPNREVWVADHLSKWNDFCTSEPVFHEVGGAHYTMIGPDYVAAFSATLRASMQARGV